MPNPNIKPFAPRKQFTYLGPDEKKRIQLEADNEMLYVEGIVYAVPIAQHSRKKNGTYARHQSAFVSTIYESALYSAEELNATDTRYQEFKAVIPKQNLAVIVRGWVAEKKMVERARIPILTSNKVRTLLKRDELPVDVAQTTNKLAVTPAPTKAAKQSRKPTKAQLLDVEKLRVQAQVKMGFDPEVRMTYVSFYLGQSEATLYRKLKTGQLPQPRKEVGGGSFWRLSQLEAYKSGHHANKPSDK